MEQKSKGFYHFCQDMASDRLSYYEPNEIEDAVYDLLDLNMISEAETLAEHGLHLHPNNETLESLTIWIYLHNHRAKEAEEMFKKYAESTEEWVLRMKFSFEALHGHPDRALKVFVNQLKENQVSPLEWINTIEDMIDVIPNEVLTPYLTEAAKYIGHNAEALGRIGAYLIDTNNYAEASVVLEKALDIDAYDIYSWQDLARSYLLQQDLTKCQEACDYGLALDENNPLLCFVKGYILHEEAKFEECIPYLEKARDFTEGKTAIRNLNISGRDLQMQANVTYEMLGLSYLETDRTDKAKECLEILAERCPSNTSAYIHLASIYMIEGDLNKAKECVAKVLACTPDDETACSLYISTLMSLQNYDEALTTLEKAIKQFPDKTCFQMAYAELLYRLNQKEKADAAYRVLLKKNIQESAYRQLLRNYFTSIGDNDALEKLGPMEDNEN
ncbi:MAG: tetratricopeptide repeat protein [Bacteroidales bacterium]|nr:tetratricopeptide repeat protein [Bacteroidales bacterium]